MDTRAAIMLKRTFNTFLGLSQILTRILQKSDHSDKDLESQEPSSPLTFEDEIFPASSRRPPEDSVSINESEYRDEEGRAPSDHHHHQIEITQEAPPYAEGPAHVFTHRDGGSKDCPALFVNREMVSVVQEVVNQKKVLRKHEKSYARLLNQIQRTERAITVAEQKCDESGGEEDLLSLQQQIESEKSKLQVSCAERDQMADRLRIFRMDLGYIKDAAQTFFEQVLGDADLLHLTHMDSPNAENESDATTHSQHCPESDGETNTSSHLSPEDLLRQAAWEKLMDQSRLLQETQQQFENWPDECDRQRQDYEGCLANGEEVPARSEIDRYFVRHGMELTSYLIEVENKHEQAKEHAIAVGAVDEDWGQPMYSNDEFEAQSWGNEEVIAHQKTKDWSRVEAWRLDVAAAVDERALGSIDPTEWANGAACLDETISEPMDIDDWDAKTIDFAQDSVSVVDHDVCNSKNISRWQEMTGHR